jgi:hypothetical protein
VRRTHSPGLRGRESGPTSSARNGPRRLLAAGCTRRVTSHVVSVVGAGRTLSLAATSVTPLIGSTLMAVHLAFSSTRSPLLFPGNDYRRHQATL